MLYFELLPFSAQEDFWAQLLSHKVHKGLLLYLSTVLLLPPQGLLLGTIRGLFIGGWEPSRFGKLTSYLVGC